MTHAVSPIAVVSTAAATAGRAAVPSIGAGGAGTPDAPMGAGGVPEGMATGGDGYRAAPAGTVLQALTAPVARVPGEPPEIVRLAQIQIELEALDEPIRDAVAVHNAGVPHMAEITRLRGLKNALLAEQAILVVRNNPVNTITPQDLMTAAERAEASGATQQGAAAVLALRPLTLTERIGAAFRAAGTDMARYPMRHAFDTVFYAELGALVASVLQIRSPSAGQGLFAPPTAMHGVAALLGAAIYGGVEVVRQFRGTDHLKDPVTLKTYLEARRVNSIFMALGGSGFVLCIPGSLSLQPLYYGGIAMTQIVAYTLSVGRENKRAAADAVEAQKKRDQELDEAWKAGETKRVQGLDAETLMKEAAAALDGWLGSHYHTISLDSPNGKLSSKALDIALSAEVSDEALVVARKFLNEDPLMQRLQELGAPMAPAVFRWYYSSPANYGRLTTTLYLLIHLGHHVEPVLYELQRIRGEVEAWEMTDRLMWLGRLKRGIDFTIAHIEAAAELEANRRRFSPAQ